MSNTRYHFFKESLDSINFRWMGPVITSLRFYFTKYLTVLIEFIAQFVFRVKVGDSLQKEVRDFSVQVELESEASEIEDRDFNGFQVEEEEEEPSSFTFKFEYQMPKNITLSDEQPSIPIAEDSYQAKTATVSNYQFLLEKDYSGFVEDPEVVTFRVHESFIDDDDDEVKLENNLLSAKDIEKPTVQQFSNVNFRSNHSLEISSNDSKPSIDQTKDAIFLKDHSLEESCLTEPFQEKDNIRSFSDFDADSDLTSLTDGISVTNNVRKAKDVVLLNDVHILEERRTDTPTTNPFREKDNTQSNYSSFETDSDSISLTDGAFVNNSALEATDVVSVNDDQILKEQRAVTSRTKPLSEEKDLGRFSGFGSDSDSISLTDDGYSVKDLVVDSESDDVLSEKDFADKENQTDFNTVQVEGEQGTGKLEEGQFSYSTGEFHEINENTNLESLLYGFRDERGFYSLNKDSKEKANGLQAFFVENCSPWTERLSQLDESWSENDSIEPELQLKELNAEAVGSTDVQLEFIDSSDDELSSQQNVSNDSVNSNSAHTKGFHEELGLDAETTKQADEEPERETDTMDRFEEAKKLNDMDGEEELDELESLWEHQDLIEQLKMELKRVRAVGLPTIFEESESPKTIDDLKPWKIDEKILREDTIDELHKFYKGYRERMRKFDILNYQKMYAIGFLHLKNPLESMGAHKPLLPTIYSHISQNLRPFNRRKSSTDASEKFIRELQIDFETVYVGQMCLSWEFLHWQYEKARELPDSDPYRSHQYNQVAGEFQQFQVILQRFIENESFQCPRLPNYVKSRCVLRNLLQVPVIKEDCLKDKMEQKKEGKGTITSELLEDIMEESIRIFWEFVKADKDETSMILKGLIGNQVELQDPADSGLMADIQASLLKKEKKLKDLLKTGNCLVKKFKKPREDRSNQDLFFSQVDMKLVSRALKMSRITTEQLLWCHKKLSKITFVDRKIRREPSFVLFPC